MPPPDLESVLGAPVVLRPDDAPYRHAHRPPRPRPVRHAPIRAREALALLAVVAVVDFACWRHEPGWGPVFGVGGFGGALVIFTVPMGLFAAARGWRRSPRLAIVSSLLALLAVRFALLPTPAVVLAAVAVGSALPLALRARRVSILEGVVTSLATIVLIPSRATALWARLAALGWRASVDRIRLLPIVVPLALCFAFALVFALANPLVANGLEWALDALRSISLRQVSRVLFWCAVAGVALLAMRPALALARDDEAAPLVDEVDGTEHLASRNALVALNALFLGYHALDATYLWSGGPPAGVTTQHYAHQGALWLTVALVMLTGVVGMMFRGALAHDPRASATRMLAYAWMAQGLLLALGTYRRIAIHVAHTGLSDLRIIGILGTTLVVAGVLLVAQKLRARRTARWLLRRQLDAFALTFVIYALAPTHYLAAQVNVARILAGETGPLVHIGPEAGHVESVAVLLPLLDHPDPRVREGVAAVVQNELICLGCEVVNRTTWRQEDLVTRGIYAELIAAAPRIGAAVDGADPAEAERVLVLLGRAAAEGRSAAELAAIARAPRRVAREPRRRAHARDGSGHFVQ